eukprot:3939797-Rhodomonas_salina.4
MASEFKVRPSAGSFRAANAASCKNLNRMKRYSESFVDATPHPTSLCRRCHCSITSQPNIQDWQEHWAHIVQKSNSLSERLLELEKELSTATEEKRIFQKMYMQTWGDNPPNHITKHTSKKNHGYLMDRVNMISPMDLTRTESSLSDHAKEDKRSKVMAWLFPKSK